MSKRKQESLFWGIVLLIIGILFLVDNLGFHIDIWEIIGNYWPLILIAIGIKNIWQHFYNKSQETQEQKAQ